MGLSKTIWTNPSEFLRIQQPVNPVMFFAPAVLQATARRFIDGFPGLVTYAVKSNPDEMVVQNLVAAGIESYLDAEEIVLGIADELALPISLVGLGEGLEDWAPFDPEAFARGLFE